ncbi:MAG TPA: hypothetical protein VFW87_04460 [Pirellulales bacterium]|nr:hypothetical protein [Pirellulales bacterium]
MSQAIRARHSKNRLRKARLERLEQRDVLSADVGLGNLAAMGQALSAQISQLTGPQSFDLSITGTQCSYSPLGLPSEMKGNLYLNGGTTSIGTYDETLTPILMSLSPEAPPQFVGTLGVATFDFNLSFGSTSPITVGSISTHDTSFIEGVGSSGQLMVGSSGTIVSSTGICTGLTGGFASHSVVTMGAAFEMQTTVHFSVQDSLGVNMSSTLRGLATIDGLTSGAGGHDWANAWATNGDAGNGHHEFEPGHQVAGWSDDDSPHGHDHHHRAVDHAFSSLDNFWADYENA